MLGLFGDIKSNFLKFDSVWIDNSIFRWEENMAQKNVWVACWPRISSPWKFDSNILIKHAGSLPATWPALNRLFRAPQRASLYMGTNPFKKHKVLLGWVSVWLFSMSFFENWTYLLLFLRGSTMKTRQYTATPKKLLEISLQQIFRGSLTTWDALILLSG